MVATNSGAISTKSSSYARADTLTSTSGTIKPVDDANFLLAYLGDGDAEDAKITFDDDDQDSTFGHDESNEALMVTTSGGGLVVNSTGSFATLQGQISEVLKWQITGGTGGSIVISNEADGASLILEDDDGTNAFECDESFAGTTTDSVVTPASGQGCLAYQNLYEGSSATAYKVKAIQNECAVIEKLANTDDDVPLWMPNAAVTVRSVSCRCDERSGSTTGCDTTLATVTLEDNSGNAMTITGTNPTCTTGTATYAAVTAANTLTAGEGLRLNVTNTPTDDGLGTYTFCWTYTYD
jgi:hypothetical protein